MYCVFSQVWSKPRLLPCRNQYRISCPSFFICYYPSWAECINAFQSSNSKTRPEQIRRKRQSRLRLVQVWNERGVVRSSVEACISLRGSGWSRLHGQGREIVMFDWASSVCATRSLKVFTSDMTQEQNCHIGWAFNMYVRGAFTLTQEILTYFGRFSCATQTY